MRHRAPEVDRVAKCVSPCTWVAQGCLGVAYGRERGEIVSQARGKAGSPIPAAERALQELRRLVRRPPSTTERPALTMRLPVGVASDETQTLCFSPTR